MSQTDKYLTCQISFQTKFVFQFFIGNSIFYSFFFFFFYSYLIKYCSTTEKRLSKYESQRIPQKGLLSKIKLNVNFFSPRISSP